MMIILLFKILSSSTSN